jgi:signal transduction histidine kinase
MKKIFDAVRRHIDSLDAEALREQYEKLSDEMSGIEALVKTLAQGVIFLDEKGNIKRTNPAVKELLGMEAENAIPLLGVTPGKSCKYEIDITYPEARKLEIQTIPSDSATLVCIRDITLERERTEDELRAGATRAVRDLAAGVAHEIGNPLNALSLNLQLLKREYPEDESIKDCLEQIERLASIIRGFLQALRPSKPNLMPGNLADPIKGCLGTMKNLFEERKVSVTLNLPNALPAVALDAEQMQQVFFNILKNALEAIKDDGAVTISLKYDDDDVITEIKDNGLGMSPEQMANVFEPYKTSKKHGTGLGLMISQRIVRDHGGSIGVESECGNGTTFTIRIPRIERRIKALKEQTT